MQASRLFSIPVAASIVMALVAATPGTPEASRHLGNSSAALSPPHPRFDASRSIPHDRADSPPSITLRLARAKDTDGDGVADRQDACPDTNPDLMVEIGGHTDNEGPAGLNRKISLERAEEVKRYLAARGVPGARMVTKGYGEVHPIASNRYAEGRAQNRRIEIKILPPQNPET